MKYYDGGWWMAYRGLCYRGWDKTIANENFPRHTGGASILDAVGYYDQTAQSDPEKLLDFSDWMGIPLVPHQVTLERLSGLLLEQVKTEK